MLFARMSQDEVGTLILAGVVVTIVLFLFVCMALSSGPKNPDPPDDLPPGA